MTDCEVKENFSTIKSIYDHLKRVDSDFLPVLSSYVDITGYSKKIFEKASRFEYWDGDCLVALIAYYDNKEDKNIFITNFSVEFYYRHDSFASRFLNLLVAKLKSKGYHAILLEVKKQNAQAQRFYNKNGFRLEKEMELSLILIKDI